MARRAFSTSLAVVVCCAVLALAALVSAQLRQCEASTDLKGHYYSCRSNGMRDMKWYWDDRNCNATGLPIPPSKLDLPCTECGAGWYLPYGETACVKCQPGTFSMRGGARFQHFDSMPMADGVFLRTWCGHAASWILAEHANEPECKGWELNGSYMSSGNVTGITKVYSVLVASFIIAGNTTGGHVTFRYASQSATNTDGFFVQEDTLSPVHMSNTAEYKEVTLSFNPGLHHLSWVYYKDAQRLDHENDAKIDLISFYGLKIADDECAPCSPGYYASNEAADECLMCQFNTYAADFGAATCIDCPTTQYALQGQPECIERTDPCDGDDYQILYTECTESSPGVFTRSRVAQWVDPLLCLLDGSTVLPTRQDGLTCAKCAPDFQRVDASGACVPCPTGHCSDGEHACQACDVGRAELPHQSTISIVCLLVVVVVIGEYIPHVV